MASMKVSPAHEKFIKAFAKRRGLSAEEGLEKILNIAQSRLKALDNYAEATGGKKGKRKAKKAAAKPAKKAAKAKSKSTKKASAKTASKTRKASASKKRASGTPKGFKAKPNSVPAPETKSEEANA
jgi:hypothetical protein